MKTFCVIGLGKFGQTLALTLAHSGCQVLAIDSDADIVNAVADSVTNAVIGDSTSEAVLRSAGVKNYDCAIVCLSDVNDNLLVTLSLKDMGIKEVVARAVSDQHKRILEKIGADRIVFPERDMGEKLAVTLAKNDVLEYINLSNEYTIIEVKVPRSWVGKTLIGLEVRRRYGVTVIGLRSPNAVKMELSPSPSREFLDEDLVTLIGDNASIDKITKNL